MKSKSASQTFNRLQAALETLYYEPQFVSSEFKKDPKAALQRFTEDPESFGRLRTYMGPIFIKRQTLEVEVAARQLLKRQVELAPFAGQINGF